MKKHVIGYFIAAIGGALIGSLATKLYVTKRHNDELKDIRQELRKDYKARLAEQTELATKDACEALDIVKQELADLKIMRNIGASEPLTKKQKEVQQERAFVIRPDEYGTRPDFARFRYIFNPDHDEFINSDYQTIVEKEEIDDMLGEVHPEDHFGEFEDEVVYIRNEDLKVDIAVYLSEDFPTADEDEE